MERWIKQAAEFKVASRRVWNALGKRIPDSDQVAKSAQEGIRAVHDFVQAKEQSDLEILDKALVGIIGAIRQIPDRRARRIANIAVGKLGGAAAVGGIAGLISSFGAASTGTAIATLHGAAATTAKLYWIGSIVGMGTAAGGVILGATGIGAAVAAMYGARKYLFGSQRQEKDLEDYEKYLLLSATALLAAVHKNLSEGLEARPDEMRVVIDQAVAPIAFEIVSHMRPETIEAARIEDAKPFSEKLTILHMRNLEKHNNALRAMVLRWKT